MRIISASRRTDMPAFYSDWLMARLQAGYCHWTNPFSGQVYRVSLEPGDVVAIVFWTRDPSPLLPRLDCLWRRGYRFYFQYTVTGYPDILESSTPGLDHAVETFRRLADSLPPGLVQWRYDPILITDATPADYHLERFAALSAALEGHTQRCYTSFAQLYGKTERNLRRIGGLSYADPPPEEKGALMSKLAAMARGRGM